MILTSKCEFCSVSFEYEGREKARKRTTCSHICARAITGKKNSQRRKSDKVRNCVICNLEFSLTVNQAADNRRTCSQECRKTLLSRSKGGLEDMICQGCGSTHQTSRYYVRNGKKYCSNACRKKYHLPTLAKYGEENHTWKGGKLEYYGSSWNSARLKAWARDKETCQECGATKLDMGERPAVHHIEPFRSFGVAKHLEANALNNLICVCRSCHAKIHHSQKKRSS